MNQKTHAIDMLHGPLVGKLVLFALPLAVTSLFQQLFNTADAMVAGRFASAQALAAISNTGVIVNMIVSLFVGLSVGATFVVARHIALDERQKIDDAVHTGMALSLISGAIVLVVGIASASAMLQALNTPAYVLDQATLYLRIYFLSMPFLLVYNFGSAIMRSEGDTLRPFLALVVGCVVNLALDLLFVLAFGWDVAGLGAATAIGYGVSAVIVVWLLCHETGVLRLDLRRLRICRAPFRTIMHIGLPAGLQGAVFALSNLIIQAAINGLGPDAMAGTTIAVNFEAFSYYITNGFCQAAVTFTSQNFVVGNKMRCRKIFDYCLLMGFFGMLAFDMICLAASYPLLSLFTSDETIISYGTVRFVYVLTFQASITLYEVPSNSMRGMGWSVLPMVVVLFGTCVLRIAWVYTVFAAVGTFESLLMVYPVSWIVSSAIMLPLYFAVRHREFKKIDARAGERTAQNA